MSDRRSNSWRDALRGNRSISSKNQLRELVRYLARRAAEDDFESLLQRQRRKKLREQQTRD